MSHYKSILLPGFAEQSFLNIARFNVSREGVLKETLGFLLGYELNGQCIVTELVLPVQEGTSSKVDDLGMCGMDTMEWMLHHSTSAKTHGDKFRFLAWVHSHVEGALCGLSSIDVHSQHVYSITFPYKVYATVFEIRKDGTYCLDWFDLTEEGKVGVTNCCRMNNLSHQQHGSCSPKSFFASYRNLVKSTDDLSLDLSDGRFTSPYIGDGVQQMSTKGLIIQELTPEDPYGECMACQKSVKGLKGLVGHVARAKQCKAFYGAEYDSLKKLQHDKRVLASYQKNKKTFCERKREKYKTMSDAEKEVQTQKRKTYNEHNKESISKRQRVYDATHKSDIALRQKQYNEKNAATIAAKQARYDQAHATEKAAKQATYNRAHAVDIAAKQAIYDKSHAEKVCHKQAIYNKTHSKKIAQKQAVYDKKHASDIALKQAAYNKKNATKIASKQTIYNRAHAGDIAVKAKVTKEAKRQPVKDFQKAVASGPVYPCICCHRLMFLSGVVKVVISDLKKDLGSDLYANSITYTNDFLVDSCFFLCKNCHLLLKRKQRPAISALNGLLLERVPKELQLSELEQQLIAKRLLFMKIFKLPRSRMLAIKDRVINVPLEDEDITQTIETLPRNTGAAGLLSVQLKRMKKLKNCHLEAFIRPEALRNALRKFKSLGNPHYQNVKERSYASETEDENISDVVSDEEDALTTEVEEEEGHYLNNTTCLVHESPENLVAVNTGRATVTKQSQVSLRSVEVAPGEGKIPTNWLREEDFDVKAFPIHFPSGRYGCDYGGRHAKVSKQKYFIQRILNIDGRFRKDHAYLFAAQQRVEREQLEKQFDIVVQRGQIKKGEKGGTILSTTDSFAAFQKVAGTPKYWQTARNEILAKVAQLGPFHLFFTLSCGEMRWPEVIAALLQLQGCKVEASYNEGIGNSQFHVNETPLEEYLIRHQINKNDLLRENILVVTRMFDNRVKKFIQHLMMSSKGPCQVEYYNYRVEFQMRGMAHIHGVMWLSRKNLAAFMSSDSKQFDSNRLPALIDTLITCGRPEDNKQLCNIVDEVQVHHHSKSCKKYGDYCRFNFPRLPSDETLIATPLSSDIPENERHKKLQLLKSTLQKVRSVLEADNLDESLTLDEVLQQAGVPYHLYKEALRTSERGTTIVLKRKVSERNINNYNPHYLQAWNANMDIQFCNDHYAVITYICDYYGKDDTGMTALLKEALKSAKGENKKEQLYCLKTTYLTHRQIGACEAIYRLLPSLHMKDSNVTCNFVSTGFPENRSVFMKRIVGSEEDDEEDGQDNEGQCSELRDGKFEKATSIHDRYANRPSSLEGMNLAEFATAYKVVKQRQKKLTFIENSSVETGEISRFSSSAEYPIQITFESSNLVVMQLRRYPSVLRIHESKKKKEEHEYYYAELLLFFPWRNETIELHRHSPALCLKKFQAHFDLICSKRMEIFPFTDCIEEAQQRLEDASLENLRSTHIGEVLDGEGLQQDGDDEVENLNTLLEPSVLHPGDITDNSVVHPVKESSLPAKYKTIDVENVDELYSLAQQLIPEQQKVFNVIITFCKKTVLSWEAGTPPPKPVRVILHGGAGSGKSNLIRAMSKWAEKVLRKAGDHPQKPRILLTAPTGMAASIIGGTTLHSAFNFNYGDELMPLSDKKMDEMRSTLSDLKLIILDEMSMVRSDMLYQLHIRLCDIFQNKELFGGTSVVLVGDLLQLKPVKGSYIFQEPRCGKYKPYHSFAPLWDEFDVYILTHNHRQGHGNKWAESLNRLRIGDTSKEEGMLSNRMISESEAKERNDACHIFYTNREVDEHNTSMLNKIPQTVTSIPAIVSLPFGCKSNDHFGRVDKTTFMRVLNVKKHARIMLIHNIDVVDNLCNGAMGKIVDIVKNKTNSVQCILVQFDSDDIGASQRAKHSDLIKSYEPLTVTPIFRADFQYQLSRGKGNSQHSATARLLQFPLRLAWAVTAHKVQGQTFKRGSHIVVHWHSRLTEGMAYVMLGRCQEEEDVSITGQFSLKSIRCNEAAKAMSNTLNVRAEQISQGWKNAERFKISLLNARCYKKHHRDFNNDFIIQGADLICVTETWLSPGEEIPLLKNHVVSAAASKGRGKGCAMLSQKVLPFKHVVLADAQILSARKDKLQIILVYRSKENNFESLVNALNRLTEVGGPFLLCGDFNILPGRCTIWNNYLSSCRLHQVVNFPTHDKGGLIDHVYVSDILLDKVSIGPHHVYFSDHVCINMEVET